MSESPEPPADSHSDLCEILGLQVFSYSGLHDTLGLQQTHIFGLHDTLGLQTDSHFWPP